MLLYAKDLFEMAWPAIINSWLAICSGVGITSQARHFIYTPGQILNHAVDYTLDIIGVEDTEDDTVVLPTDLATHALNELLRCFHYTMLNEFEGKDHVKRKMSNYTEFKVNKRKYPTDFANAIDCITSIDDDEIHAIISDACTAAARAEVCTYQCAYHWRVLRLSWCSIRGAVGRRRELAWAAREVFTPIFLFRWLRAWDHIRHEPRGGAFVPAAA